MKVRIILDGRKSDGFEIEIPDDVIFKIVKEYFDLYDVDEAYELVADNPP